ncbi:hypothetical protein [Amycolatopsis sp. NBRC 101858]|nr:hypothetical protein [Amycolatopsis sp. NBRC 101858]
MNTAATAGLGEASTVASLSAEFELDLLLNFGPRESPYLYLEQSTRP